WKGRKAGRNEGALGADHIKRPPANAALTAARTSSPLGGGIDPKHGPSRPYIVMLVRRAAISKTSPRRPGAATPTPPRHRIADDEVVARNVREAAKVDAVGEAIAAGRKALVAAGGDREC